MKKHILKSLLLSVLMMLGVTNVQAESWSIDFATLGASYDDKTGVTISQTVATIGGTTMGTCTVGSEPLNEKFVLQTGTTWMIRKANGLYQGNGGGRAMGFLGCTKGQTITIVGTGDPNPSTNATLKSHTDNTYVYSVSENGDVKFTPARYLYFTSVSVDDPSASSVNYTVKYVDSESKEVKGSTTGSGEPNASITLTETEKASFFNAGNTIKYIYESDDAEGQTIASNGSTVVTITFREAATYNYTLVSSLGGTITSGSYFEGETVYAPYPRYHLKDGAFYEAAVTNKEYRKTVALTEDNVSVTVNYTAKDGVTAAFYAEAENIDGMTLATNNNIPVRASNATAATSTNDVTITSLAPGKYKFHVGIFTSKSNPAGNAMNFGIGSQTFAAAFTGVNLNEIVSEEYTLEENTTIKYLGTTSWSGGEFDYIWIEKTGDVVKNYTVDFNTAISTSARDFSVASNWDHQVDYNSYYDNHMSYSYSSSGGVEASGALLAYQQLEYDYGQQSSGKATYDLLITPEVKGTVTLSVKKYNNSNSYIEFYALSGNSGNWTRGDKIDYEFVGDATELSTTDWVTVKIYVDEFAHVGIRGSYVYMDNFAAENAIIIPEKKILIASADPTATTGTIKWDQQANGKVLVKYTVTVTNNGEVNLTQGTEGYSISIINGTTGDVLVTTPVPQNLAIGETSDPFDVETEVETSLWPNSYTYIKMNLRENLKNSVVERAQSGYNAYEPKFVFRAAESSSTSSITAAEAWGTITESTTKSFEIANTGIAPLTIKSITLPEGFTSDNVPVIPTEGLTIAKGAKQALNITQDATATGTFAGTLTIVYLDKDAAEQTYTLAFSATVIGANTWTADFNNSTSTPVYPEGSVAEGGINSDYDYNSGTYNIWLTGRTQSSYQSENNKFITPKLHASAGAQLSYDVKGAYGSSYYAKVYVSTDRKNWEQKAFYTQNATEGAEAIGYSDWFTKTLTFDTEGDYYVAFALYGTFKIDNLVGLEKVDVAHDLYVKSVSWPDASVKSGTSLSKPSVEIIPLTNEAADAYTVKYVCGETVLAEATSAALTASANSSKTFTFNWTPSVENTTVYENTKVVFDFGGGVTFETAPFTLTVTNESKFHFVNSIPSSKWNEPTDYTTPITFGKTNAAGSKTFYVYNWGSAPLTVKSITVPAGFTVTPAEQFNVVAFDENNLSAAAQAVEITFSATEAGTYSGDMVITYLNGAGEEQTFTLAVSGTKLDPTKWYANFGSTSGQWPAGSVYQSSVSTSDIGTYSDPDYAITSTSTTNNLFVTPKLTAVAGDKLMFDAKLYSIYWSEGKVVVYAAATREEVLNAEEGTTRVQLFSVSGEDETNPMTTDFQTFEVSVPAGEWYLGFEISGRPYVDEIYGLQQVAVAHDWQIASSSIPAEVMQNTEATATINIRNLGLTAEAANSYKATLYVDEEPIATVTETAAIPTVNQLSATGTQISIPFHYGVVGTVKAYIVVEAADGYKVNTDAVDINFTGEIATADGKQVGTQSGTGRDYGFVDWYNNDGSTTRYTDILYPADKIGAAGIKAGDKITSISFKASNSTKTFKAVVTSWVGLSTGDITYGSPVKVDMQEVEVYNGSIAFPANEESVITLSEPIVWDGTSDIRVYTEAVGQGSGNWMSANYAYDSSINMSYNGSTKAAPVAFFTLAAESATLAGTVTLGGSTVEGATVTLTSEDEDKVQYTGTTNASGEYSIEVIQSSRTYTVTADKDGYSATVTGINNFSAPVNLALVDLPELTFGDADFSTTETKANVTVTRSLKAGWNAIILPVTLTAGEVTSAFGTNAEVAVYSKDEDAENVTIQFSKTTKIVAGTPCLLWLEEVPATAPRFENKDINTTVNKVSGQSFSFTGVYEATTIKAGDYFVKNGGFKKAGNNNTVKPFRSYLQLNEGASARSIRFFIDDEEIAESEITGIETVKQTVAPQGTYSMSGQKMEGKLRKGLYIINGKKVMVK